MSDYVPKFNPGQDITSTTSAAVVGGELLAVSGTGTVAKTSAASASVVGVAKFDAASGAKVGISTGGVQILTASGGIAAGALVVSAADGKAATIGANTFDKLIGLALTTATDGNPVEILMER